MQFGKIQGIALAAIGIILVGIQTLFYMTPKNVIGGPTAISQMEHHAVSPLFGIVGLILLIVGAAIVATASRRDEPDRKNAVR
jgi:hypothetical protein